MDTKTPLEVFEIFSSVNGLLQRTFISTVKMQIEFHAEEKCQMQMKTWSIQST